MLAQSIRRDGLMNPITVRPPIEDENGVKTYEIIAGERRFWAHKWLCDHGDDFSMIECCVRTGDTWTLQMIENIQRTDLSQREKEYAISEAMESGMTMTEIAEKLCKPISYVSDIVAGIKVRRAADEAALDTDEISTKALSQLRSIPKEKQPEAVKELKKRGGSVRAATEILNEAKPKPPKASESKSPDLPETFPAETKVIEEPEIEPADALAAESKHIRKNLPCALVFVNIHTWQAKNKMHKLILEKVLPFQHMLVKKFTIPDFFQKLQNVVAEFGKEFPHSIPMTVELSDVDKAPLIVCRPANDPLFFNLFTISFTKICGFVEDYLGEM